MTKTGTATKCGRCNGSGVFAAGTIHGECYGCGGTGSVDRAATKAARAETAAMFSERKTTVETIVSAGVPSRYAVALVRAMRADENPEPWISGADAGMALAAAEILGIVAPRCASEHPYPMAPER